MHFYAALSNAMKKKKEKKKKSHFLCGSADCSVTRGSS